VASGVASTGKTVGGKIRGQNAKKSSREGLVDQGKKQGEVEGVDTNIFSHEPSNGVVKTTIWALG